MFSPAGLRPWRCLTWPARVALWMTVTAVLAVEVKVGIALPTAIGVVIGAIFVSGPLALWVQRGLLPKGDLRS
jgi:hypothetical protein